MKLSRRPVALRRAIALGLALAALTWVPSATAADAAGGAAAPDASQTLGAGTSTIATATTSPSSPGDTRALAGSSAGAAAIGGGAIPLSKTSSGSGTAARQHSSGGGELSGGAILAAVLAGLIAIACLVWAAFRWLAVEPRWTLPVRHSIAEAGFRASAVWAEFADWFRLGH